MDAGDGNHNNGLTVYEAADYLLNQFGVWNAIQLDDGGSTTLGMVDPSSAVASVINTPSDNPTRLVGASLLVMVVPEPSTVVLLFAGIGTGLLCLAWRAQRAFRLPDWNIPSPNWRGGVI